MTKAKRDHAWVEICQTIERKLHRTDESRRAQDLNSIKNQSRPSRKAESEVPVATMTLRGGHIAKLLLTTDSEILDRFITTLVDSAKVLYLIHAPSARWRSIDPKLNKPLGFRLFFLWSTSGPLFREMPGTSLMQLYDAYYVAGLSGTHQSNR